MHFTFGTDGGEERLETLITVIIEPNLLENYI
jgi:hypothetical protein